MKMQQLLMTTAFLLISCVAGAHALWIETAPYGKKGQPQEVKVFYGEYADGERDPVSKWYSDVKELTLWLIAPDGSRTKLACRPEPDHLGAAFTPAEDGSYTLFIAHDARDFPATTRYQFNANAAVSVGKTPASSFRGNDIHVISQQGPGKSILISAFLNGAPAPGMHVEIVSPEGWRKNFITDEKGTLTFSPGWKGRYMLEITHTEKKTGEHGSKKYESTWRCSTNSFIWK